MDVEELKRKAIVRYEKRQAEYVEEQREREQKRLADEEQRLLEVFQTYFADVTPEFVREGGDEERSGLYVCWGGMIFTHGGYKYGGQAQLEWVVRCDQCGKLLETGEDVSGLESLGACLVNGREFWKVQEHVREWCPVTKAEREAQQAAEKAEAPATEEQDYFEAAVLAVMRKHGYGEMPF